MSLPSNINNKARVLKIFTLGLITLSMALAVACGDERAATPKTLRETFVTSTLTGTPTPMPFRVTVTSSNGKEVIFNEPPQRIVSYSSGPVEILFAMGENERIIATHDYLNYPPEAVELTRIGSAFTINLEKIVELEPDLIYTFFGSSVPDLEATGVPVLYLESPNNLQGIADEMRMWGRITDNPEAAEEIAANFEQDVAKIETLIEQIPGGLTLFHDDTEFFTSGPNTLVGQVYTLLKADNIAFDTPDGLYGQLSQEIVVERDPEIIITPFDFRLQQILDDPALQGISALVNGRVYLVDATLVEVAGPRYVQAVEQLARLIHPDLFD